MCGLRGIDEEKAMQLGEVDPLTCTGMGGCLPPGAASYSDDEEDNELERVKRELFVSTSAPVMAMAVGDEAKDEILLLTRDNKLTRWTQDASKHYAGAFDLDTTGYKPLALRVASDGVYAVLACDRVLFVISMNTAEVAEMRFAVPQEVAAFCAYAHSLYTVCTRKDLTRVVSCFSLPDMALKTRTGFKTNEFKDIASAVCDPKGTFLWFADTTGQLMCYKSGQFIDRTPRARRRTVGKVQLVHHEKLPVLYLGAGDSLLQYTYSPETGDVTGFVNFELTKTKQNEIHNLVSDEDTRHLFFIIKGDLFKFDTETRFLSSSVLSDNVTNLCYSSHLFWCTGDHDSPYRSLHSSNNEDPLFDDEGAIKLEPTGVMTSNIYIKKEARPVT